MQKAMLFNIWICLSAALAATKDPERQEGGFSQWWRSSRGIEPSPCPGLPEPVQTKTRTCRAPGQLQSPGSELTPLLIMLLEGLAEFSASSRHPCSCEIDVETKNADPKPGSFSCGNPFVTRGASGHKPNLVFIGCRRTVPKIAR